MAISDFSTIANSDEVVGAFIEARERLADASGEMGGVELTRAYSDLTDAVVERVFHIAVWEGDPISSADAIGALGQIAVTAVGGYGRREMSPYSDCDVAFLVGGEEDENTDRIVKRAFRLLMEVIEGGGLKVGYSYRRVDDVENLELDTQTALLEARRIVGSTTVFDAFYNSLRSAISPAEFVIGHVQARGADLAFDTPYLVEPNVKEGHGGLRDLHAARWIAQVAYRIPPDRVWEGIRARGVLVDSEIDDIQRATEFATRTRNSLHLIAGRGLDLLGHERHAEIAERLGFSSLKDFTSLYYAHAAVLWRAARKVGQACLEERLEIEPGITAEDGMLRLPDRELLRRDRAAVVRVFQHAQSYGLRICRGAADLLRSAATDYQPNHEAAHTFLDTLSRRGASATLRSMADIGVLQAIVPQFDNLMKLVPEDLAHRFTVGEHSLRAVEQLEALFADDDERLGDILSRVQDTEALFLATLMHDIGKLDSKGDHSKTGAFRASKLARSLGMREESCAKVEFLVRHHLRMAETARLRDLAQRKTIRDFVSVVRDRELLDMLFLLTVADQRAVGSKNWSQVQVRFLFELHERASAAIRSPDAAGADIERHRQRVRKELRLSNLPDTEVDEHCASMPADYLLNTPPEELAAHIGYVRSVRSGQPVVDMRDDRTGHFTRLTVLSKDRPGLLSDIAGVLYATGIDVHAAQIFTRSSETDNIAIDVLYVDFEGRQLTEMKKWQVEGELLPVLSGEVTVDELLFRRGKKPFDSPENLRMNVQENLSDHETVIEFRAVDAPGILHYFTRRLAEKDLVIHNARVATWGHEARDAFYVTTREGNKLGLEPLLSLQ